MDYCALESEVSLPISELSPILCLLMKATQWL